MLEGSAPVGPGVPVTHLTHRDQVADMVSATSRPVMGFPRSMQHGVAPGSESVARGTHDHRAFALPSGTRVQRVSGGLSNGHDRKPRRA